MIPCSLVAVLFQRNIMSSCLSLEFRAIDSVLFRKFTVVLVTTQSLQHSAVEKMLMNKCSLDVTSEITRLSKNTNL